MDAREEEKSSSQSLLLEENMLRERVIDFIKSEGFYVNPHIRPINDKKSTLRSIHAKKRLEQFSFHKKFLLANFDLAKQYSVNGNELEPNRIELELIEVKPNSMQSRLFLWWNLAWWSLPFDKPIGRQMRFILWDKGHNAPFGLICLQSQPFRSAVRDKFLKLCQENLEFWINQSMYAQRVGALPPYNQLIGGKMVVLSLVSNEIRDAYKKKYADRETIMRKRKMPSDLLFLTTSSAYGKSSMYERVKFKNQNVSEFVGMTSGAGTFHISEPLYMDLLTYLKQRGVNVTRGYGTGSSRKLKLVSKAFSMLKLPKYTFHNIRRGYYVFSNVMNLMGVIHKNESPKWHDRPFNRMAEFWVDRWCIPRSKRVNNWHDFQKDIFFCRFQNELQSL